MAKAKVLTVEKTIITLDDIKIDAYTANEREPNTGGFVNYLSGRGLAKSIEVSDKTTRPSSLPKELKAMLGERFTTRPSKYQNNSGAFSKINLWDVTSASIYYAYHFKQGNKKAKAIVIALISTSLDIIINDAFGREYQSGQAEKWAKARARGIQTRRFLTDAIKDWYERNPGATRCPAFAMYARVTDAIYQALWGMRAKELETYLGCNRYQSRDHLDLSSLNRLDLAEEDIRDIIDDNNVKPIEAVETANIQKSRRLPFVELSL